jgi:speckle-type POZ protein
MLKTQRFSSLFRHYAKYHGLRKDDLEYYFVNQLENEDTPESVQLQRGDTIMVRKRRKPEPPEAAADDDEFFKDMRDLLDDEEHMDAIFIVRKPEESIDEIMDEDEYDDDEDDNDEEGNDTGRRRTVKIRAHKSILTARTDYFKALFRKGTSSSLSDGSIIQVAFRESDECEIKVDHNFTPSHIHNMLEFIYTNRIQKIRSLSTDDLLSLLHLSDKWLVRDLKRLVEHELIRHHMSVHTVARMYGATDDFHAQRLSKACIEFIMSNLRQVTGNTTFEEEMKNYPHLCIPVLKAAADMIPEGPVHKKQRTDHGTSSATTPGAGGLGSSPVPDMDV